MFVVLLYKVNCKVKMALNSKQQMKPYHKNPRRINKKQFEQLRENLLYLGDLSGIVHDLNSNEIVGGNQRSSVFDVNECDVEIVHQYDYPDEQGTIAHGFIIWKNKRYTYRQVRWTPKQCEQANITANRLGGEWDFDELANWDMSDLLTWGFEESDFPFDVAPATNKGADAEPQIDKAEELRQKWDVQSGQMWQLGEHRIVCGDCTDRAVVERVMGGEKADLAWFDPPFGINLKPQRQKTEAIENDGKEDAQLLWCNFLPILKENMILDTHLFLCQNWSEFDWTMPLVRKHFTIKSKVVWNKNVWGIGYYTRPKHEDILYCWYGEPPTIDVPVADVWDIARENAPIHAAEKPPELSSIAIEHFSKKKNVVIDWFSGVGGTIIACENLSRKARAVEISPAYVAVAIQRWVDVTGKEPILLDA